MKEGIKTKNNKKKKRILVLNYEFPPLGGGASPVSYEISRSYVKKGHKVDVVTMSFKNLPKYEKKEGINIYRVPCIRRKKEICHPWEQFTYIISAKRFLKKHLKKNKYDIVHVHFAVPTGIIAKWIKKKFNIPYIITVHGSDIPGYNPDRFKFLHKFTNPLIKKIFHNSKKIISPSNYLKELIEKRIGNYEIETIPNGIFTKKFNPEKKEKKIVSTGRLLKRKRFQDLIKAVSNKDVGYEIHVIGNGPMMNKLKKLALKSKTKIVFHGWLNNNSKKYKELLETASIYILASEKENSPISLLEAMSSGCSVITTNTTGCAETIKNSGLVFEPKNIKDLKEKINYLIKDNKKIKEYGKKARREALKKYDWNNIIKEYEKHLYE